MKLAIFVLNLGLTLLEEGLVAINYTLLAELVTLVDVCLRVEANALLLHYLLFKSSLPLLLLLTCAVKLLKTLLALRVT